VSGSDKGLRLERPGLRKIRASWGTFDVIVFAKLDRMARSVVDFMTFADEAKSHGAELVSVNENLDLTTPAGRFVATILSGFSEMEAAVIASRVKESVDGLRRSGRYAGGNLPFGYHSVKDPNSGGKILEPEPSEAAEIRSAARRVLEGETLYSIMMDLNNRGVRTRRNGTWSVQALRQILTSESIQGRVIHRGEVIRDETTGLALEVWTPILDSETVRRLRAVIITDKMPGTTRRRRETARLLSGIVCCLECGETLYPKTSQPCRRMKAPRVSYDCSSRSNGRPCSGVSIQAQGLDDFVSSEFLKRRGHWEVVEIIESGADEIKAADVEVAINDTVNEMREYGANMPLLNERLDALKAQKEEIGKSERQTILRGTGKTYAQAWAEHDDKPEADQRTARRRLLLPNIDSLKVGKGVRGKTGPIDPSRLDLKWKKLLVAEAVDPKDYELNRATVPISELTIGPVQLKIGDRVWTTDELETELNTD